MRRFGFIGPVFGIVFDAALVVKIDWLAVSCLRKIERRACFALFPSSIISGKDFSPWLTAIFAGGNEDLEVGDVHQAVFCVLPLVPSAFKNRDWNEERLSFISNSALVVFFTAFDCRPAPAAARPCGPRGDSSRSRRRHSGGNIGSFFGRPKGFPLPAFTHGGHSPGFKFALFPAGIIYV